MAKFKIPYGTYTKEFREDAVRLVMEGGLSAGTPADRLSMPKSTLERWIKVARKGRLGDIGKSHPPLTELEVELARVKRELAIVQMERDILKKAAAYFAKESLQGTR
jgi:transposase